MATRRTTTGLLSKVVKFVRHPTKDWSELDSIVAEPELEPQRGYSKQSLKEMIERRRQNDFVRAREFDELRKLRRSAPVINAESSERPSLFQATVTSTNFDERASTLKKIDEIEAQMSKQWWKGKQGDAMPQEDTSPASASLSERPADTGPMAGAANEEMDSFETLLLPEIGSEQGQGTGFDATLPGVLQHAGMAAAAVSSPTAATVQSLASRYPQAGSAGLALPSPLSLEFGDGLADTDLEEAAIRFANGDDAGAEACLLAALKTENGRSETGKARAAALLGLYRATGQRGSFDRVATEYVQRFGQAAPVWFSTPDLLGRRSGSPAFEQVSLSKQTSRAIWECPAELDFQTVQDLRTGLSQAAEPWQLDWHRFHMITPAAGEALADLFAQWCVQPVLLHFEGAEVLEKALRSLTPSGDKSVALFWWRLRLDGLRILRLQDEFELAALDYCVTYEVSPPPWQDVQCQCVYRQINATSFRNQSDESDAQTFQGSVFQPDHGVAEPMESNAISASVIELSGEVLGDATEALNKLQAGLEGANRLVVSCDGLIRVDFSAAGTILTWVAAREAEGRQVQFSDVPRLIAAFFDVIGISEHARVMVRAN